VSAIDRPRAAANPVRRFGAREPGPSPATRRDRRAVGNDAEESVDPEQPGMVPAGSGVPARLPQPPRRALVLGGGGVLGFAWTVGALSALEVEARFDARDVEIVVGTSAGAVAAAALGCGVTVDQMRRHHQGFPSSDDPSIAFEYDTTGHGLPPRPGFGLGSPRLLLGAIRHPAGTRTLLALTGALPTGRGTLQPVADMVTGIVTDGGLDGEWPARPRPWIVAVDYWSGRRVVFGRDDVESLTGPGVALADAVVASCSIPGWYPPMRIGARPYIDGGAASNASADVLRDAPVDEVYVLAPMASIRLDRPRSPVARVERSIRRSITRGLLADIAQLRAAGKRVIFVCPGPEDLAVIGANLMNPRRRVEVLAMAMRTSAIALRTQLAVHTHPHAEVRSVSVAQ
jgi:NTE family protein